MPGRLRRPGAVDGPRAPGSGVAAWTGDLIVGWSNGETTLHADTTTRLGRECMLMPAKVK
ncbi:hypothetical protein AB0D04_30450 [Streptomyces sp. NPDC048483]|uniref:hypothetical protein n=1 Tax=Streptomyces sp. NPDC048483 TaxID=3154927 RepID=UPI00341AD972